MAWTTIADVASGEVIASSWGNAIRDNLLQTAPAKVTTAGDLVYATAANALARLALGSAGLALIAGASSPSWGRLDVEGHAQTPAAVVYRNTDLAIPHNTWTGTFTFNQELVDNGGMHSAGGHGLTVQKAGLYLIWAQAILATNATGVRGIRFYVTVSGATGYRARRVEVANPTAATDHDIFTVALQHFAVADTIFVEVFQTSGGDLNCLYSSPSNYLAPQLGAAWLAPIS